MNIYNDFYNIIAEYIYGGEALTPYMELVATSAATIGSLLLLAIPFVVTWKIIKLFL